jgi:hypothetical protein
MMRLPLILGVTAVMVLTSCGGLRESRLNPLNWFKRSQVVMVDETVAAVPADPRPLVDQVLALAVEPTAQGALVRATGLSPIQGFYNAELVARPVDENGVLVFDFRIMPPPQLKPVGTARTRQVTVAAALSTVALESVREIVVQGANNARSSRR